MILQRGEGHGLVCESSNSVYPQLADQRPLCIIGKSCSPRDVSGTSQDYHFEFTISMSNFSTPRFLEIQQLSELDLLQKDDCCDWPAFTFPTLLGLENGNLPDGG